jgi:two-component system chemotaxis response regulator CheY
MSEELAQVSILLIDDQHAVRTIVTRMLREAGFAKVYQVKDGQDAIRFFDEMPGKVNFVICDWMMPGMTGLELLRQLRATDTDVTFLMMTAKSDAESVRAAATAGVNGYIVKPFTRDQLFQKVQAMWQKRLGIANARKW